MLDARIEKRDLQQILDSLFLADEAMVHISKKGLKSRVVDEANVGKAQMEIRPDCFTEFEAQSMTLGLNLDLCRDVIKKADSDEILTLKTVENHSTLEIIIGNQESYISLFNSETMTPAGSIPVHDPNLIATLDAKDFKGAVDAASMFADSMRFRWSGEERKMYLEARSDDNRTQKVLTEEDILQLESGEADSEFGLYYMSGIAKALDGTSAIQVGLSVQRPMEAKFQLANGHGEVQYFVAPRVENN